MAHKHYFVALSKISSGASGRRRNGQVQTAEELSLQAPGAPANPLSFSSFLAGEHRSQISLSAPLLAPVRTHPSGGGGNPNARRSSQRYWSSHASTSLRMASILVLYADELFFGDLCLSLTLLFLLRSIARSLSDPRVIAAHAPGDSDGRGDPRCNLPAWAAHPEFPCRGSTAAQAGTEFPWLRVWRMVIWL